VGEKPGAKRQAGKIRKIRPDCLWGVKRGEVLAERRKGYY
jgi:hypothetical protein